MGEIKVASVSGLQKGSYLVIDGAACRVTDIAISRPGKHGHAKVNLTAVGLIDGKKRTLLATGHDNVDVPIVEKKNAQVLSITGSKANVMDTVSFETFDLDIPEDLKVEVVEGCEILYWDILDQRVMKQVKKAQ